MQRSKTSLFTDYMGIYTDNRKEPTKRLIKLISEFSNTARNKANTCKNQFYFSILATKYLTMKKILMLSIKTSKT